MAQFEIDRQTIADLGLFSEEGVPVYSFFKHTLTIGGERKLRQMMETPSFDFNILHSRKQTIQFFYDHKLNLPVNKKDLDFIEHYLAYNREPLKTNILDISVTWIKERFSTVNHHYIISQGIRNIHELLIILNGFCERVGDRDSGSPVAHEILILRSFLLRPEIRQLLIADPAKSISFFKLSHYDNLFRKTEMAAIKNILNIVYEFDACIAAGQAVENYGFCFPEYLESGECFVELSGLHHPCIKNAVANDVLIGAANNVFFLTGANMAGKSSFLKALGLAVYLGHVGFPVPAKYMRTSVFKGLITTINLADNIDSGYSHYFSEINRVKQTAIKIGEQDRLFVIFDELFRGTNVKDAYDASLATIAALSEIKNSVFLVSTHIVEIAAELKDYENIGFQYFDSNIANGKPVFDYKLKKGVSSETLGYYIFENEGIIEILKQAAKA